MLKLEEVNEALPHVVNVLQNSMRVLAYHLGGSTYITGEGNDADIVVLTDCLPIDGLINMGWTPCNKEYATGKFVALRSGTWNIILCTDTEYYRRWEIARNVCKYIFDCTGRCDKEMRVLLHQLIKGGDI